MIECPYCHSVFPDNTLFCEECGSYLSSTTNQETSPLTGSVQANDDRGGVSTLVLSVRDGGSVELPLSREVIIGRLDARQGVFPDVDLTNEEGVEKGLSRRHARILRQEGQVYLEDLHSLNGTFLNSVRLVPEVPQLLKDGDQVQLGKLVLTVHLK